MTKLMKTQGERVTAMLSDEVPYISDSGDEIGVAHGEIKGMVTLYVNRRALDLTVDEVEALRSALRSASTK